MEIKEMEINKCYAESAESFLVQLPDNFVDLTVTSPPYDSARKYNGYSFDFETVARELYRVTKPGGVVVWVVGDQTTNGSESGTSFRQALFFKDVCGFNLHDTMIYKKQNPIPQFKFRYTNSFEYMFVLSKGKPKTLNLLTESTKLGGRIDKNYKGQLLADATFISKQEKIIKNKKVRENIWEYSANNGIDRNIKHPAQFPEKLAEDHILSWSNEGDLVLDCFAGSGTTPKMAKQNNRNYLVCEISKEYCKIIERRLADLNNSVID